MYEHTHDPRGNRPRRTDRPEPGPGGGSGFDETGRGRGHRGRDRGGFRPDAGPGSRPGFPGPGFDPGFMPGFGPGFEAGGFGRGRGGGPERGFGPSDRGFGPGGGRRARRGKVREAVIALLAEEPRNGYQVITGLAEKTDGAWRPSPGAVYPCLSQLEDEGLVTAEDRDGQKVFVLTETGREEATRIGDTPWSEVAGGRTPPHRDESRAAMTELRHLAKALEAIAWSGTPAQITQATERIAALRRSLYAILAEDPTPPTE